MIGIDKSKKKKNYDNEVNKLSLPYYHDFANTSGS